MDGFERRRELKKRNILEASLDLFLEYGVQKVSIAEIAKKAMVSQVTIYNYFGSKDQLIHDVIIYFADQLWEEYERLFQSDMPFPEKVKTMIFDKTKVASAISEDFYTTLMKDYSLDNNYIEQLYTKKVLPGMIELFEEGKQQGYVDPNLSNEAIMIYIQLFTEYFQRKEAYDVALPFTEELTKMFFYGIVGKPEKP